MSLRSTFAISRPLPASAFGCCVRGNFCARFTKKEDSHMEKSNFALRLLPSLHKAAQRIAERENCSVNQLINVALAEKIAVLDADYWNEREKAAAKRPKTDVLKRLAG